MVLTTSQCLYISIHMDNSQEQIDKLWQDFLADPDGWLTEHGLSRYRLAKMGGYANPATAAKFGKRGRGWPPYIKYALWCWLRGGSGGAS